MQPTSPSSTEPLPQTRRSAFIPTAFRFILMFSMLAAQISAPSAAADQAIAGEYELKAAMLYHLIQFVDWPSAAYPDPQAPHLLCVLGSDPFGNSLTSLASKQTLNDRPVQVRHVQNDPSVRACQVLYISSSERNHLGQILSNLQSANVLTVGEMSQFAARGGMVQFALQDKKVHFDINLDAASHSGLKISSRLLALAHIVK
jgi:uncharacterized protein DUF4154